MSMLQKHSIIYILHLHIKVWLLGHTWKTLPQFVTLTFRKYLKPYLLTQLIFVEHINQTTDRNITLRQPCKFTAHVELFKFAQRASGGGGLDKGTDIGQEQ